MGHLPGLVLMVHHHMVHRLMLIQLRLTEHLATELQRMKLHLMAHLVTVRRPMRLPVTGHLHMAHPVREVHKELIPNVLGGRLGCNLYLEKNQMQVLKVRRVMSLFLGGMSS